MSDEQADDRSGRSGPILLRLLLRTDVVPWIIFGVALGTIGAVRALVDGQGPGMAAAMFALAIVIALVAYPVVSLFRWYVRHTEKRR